MNNKLKILDCTIRDGGYINNWNFSNECVSELYNILNDINYDYFEIGFKNKFNFYKNNLCGKWRFCQKKDIEKIMGLNLLRVVEAVKN